MSANVFLAKWSELEGRYDPQFYKTRELYKNLDTLKKYAIVKGGKRIPKGFTFSLEQTGYLYLRVEDIDSLGEVNYETLKNIDETIFEILKNYQLNENDVIISIAGTIGKISIFKEVTKPVILTENCAKIIIKSDELLPDYFKLVLQTDFVQNQFISNYIQTTIPKLGLERIANTFIPKIPTKDYQNKIISKMDEAYRQKADKEVRAQAILNGIDGYLLSELGIIAPDIDNKALSKKIFTRKMSEVSGKRFDPSSYADGFSFIDTVFDLVTFSDHLFIDPYSKMDETLEVTFLPMEKISDEYGEADTSLSRNMESSKGYTKFQENDLLWSKITPCMENGKSAVVRRLQNGIGFGSTEYFVFRPRHNDINIDYIHALLRLKVFRQTATRFFTGTSGHQRVSSDFFKTLKIPLPPFEKQYEIADRIVSFRAEAKRLRDEAAQQFEIAKTEVEKMIVGEQQ